MRLELDRLGRFKTFIHMGAGGLVALSWILSLAAITQKGSAEGRLGWFFGLCWLTIPVLIYQTMVPIWSRAYRFANVYAFAGLDIGSALAWFSAWVVLASYVIGGKGKGSDSKKSGCDNFKYGNAAKCKLSEASIIFGVLIMLTFCATAYISFKGLMEYKRTGIAPGPAGFARAKGYQSSSGVGSGGLGGVKPTSPMNNDDNAFDARMNLRHDMEEEEPQRYDDYNTSNNNTTSHHQPYDSSDYADQQEGSYIYSSVGHGEQGLGSSKPYLG